MISTVVIYDNITGTQIKRLCEQKKIITKASHSEFKYSASLFSSEMPFFPQNTVLCVIKSIVDAVYLEMLLHFCL